MQVDFHYCTIRILAEKAGFDSNEAGIIAYASQYVDDAIDHEMMKVSGNPEIFQERFDGENFNPICTSHTGIQYIKGLRKMVQDKVYIPFHFLPDFDFAYGLRVYKNNATARKLVRNALSRLKKLTNEHREFELIKLGIALHSWADSWAHQGFSGSHSSKHNDIRGIELYRNGHWQTLGKFKVLEYNMLPDIGHAEAGSFPDISHLRWRYIKESDGRIYERDNPAVFMEAARQIASVFELYEGKNDWKLLEPLVYKCFCFESDSLEEKVFQYSKLFPDIHFSYDKNQWKNESLILPDRPYQLKLGWNDSPHYKQGIDKKWFYFHRAAYQQREYIMGLLRKIRS